MKAKLITKANLERLLVWIDTALQAIQQSIPDPLPTMTGKAGQVLAVNSNETGTQWVPQSSGNAAAHDFTHAANTSVSASAATVTFAANQRGSKMITVSADIDISFAVNNGSDNYLWVKNSGGAEIDVTVSAVTCGEYSVADVYMPSDGITVPAGGVCEIGVIVNADGCFITSRNDLEL